MAVVVDLVQAQVVIQVVLVEVGVVLIVLHILDKLEEQVIHPQLVLLKEVMVDVE